mmetsp:Transcript_10495/g.23875  ORF Transcript_10495/g.23875 Transcript_10495/m.23875 type:complete len:944 (-) Transcript_10495:26-2857(-)
MVLTFEKTVRLQSARLSCLYYTSIIALLVVLALGVHSFRLLHGELVVTSTSQLAYMRASLELTPLNSTVLRAATEQQQPSRYGQLCQDATTTGSVDRCSGAEVICSGASLSCMSSVHAAMTLSSREVFLATTYELRRNSADGSGGIEKGLLTTADAQEVVLHYRVSSRATDQLSPNPCALGCEVSRSEQDNDVWDETALTVVLDSFGAPWKWIQPEEAKEQGGVRFSMGDLMVLAGLGTSADDPSSWLDAWLRGSVLQVQVSCHENPADDDDVSRDMWDGPTCYVRVDSLRSAFAQPQYVSAIRLTEEVGSVNETVLVENHLHWQLHGVQARVELSWTTYEVHGVKLSILVVMLFMALIYFRVLLRFFVLNCMGNLSAVWARVLCTPFSIMSDIAAATVEGVVHGISYREIDGEGSLDAQGTMPLKTIELQVEQAVVHMQPSWSDQQVTNFTRMAVQSLEPKDPKFQMPRRCERWSDCESWRRCFNKMFCVAAPRKAAKDGLIEVVPVDRFVAAKSQHQYSRMRMHGELLKHHRCTNFLEWYFMPAEVVRCKWVFDDARASWTQTQAEMDAARAATPDKGTALRTENYNNSMDYQASHQGGATNSGGETMEHRHSQKKMAKMSTMAVAGRKSEVDMAPSPTGRISNNLPSNKTVGSGTGGPATARFSIDEDLSAYLKRPTSIMCMSTRFFAFQLAVYDKEMLHKLGGVEEKHQAVASFWRTKSTLLCDRLDNMEIGIEQLRKEVKGLHEASITSPAPADLPQGSITSLPVRSGSSVPSSSSRKETFLQDSRAAQEARQQIGTLQEVLRHMLARAHQTEVQLELKPTAADVQKDQNHRAKSAHKRGHAHRQHPGELTDIGPPSMDRYGSPDGFSDAGASIDASPRESPTEDARERLGGMATTPKGAPPARPLEHAETSGAEQAAQDFLGGCLVEGDALAKESPV